LSSPLRVTGSGEIVMRHPFDSGQCVISTP
jgi:hypothetical protein